jgi:hypothetical protein
MPIYWVFIQATRNDWTTFFEYIKVQCSHVVMCLISKFEHQFLNQELMNATCIIYLHYWLNLLAEETLWIIVSLKVHLCFEKVIVLTFDQVQILAFFFMKVDLILEHFSSNHYAKQPRNCFGITNTMQPCHIIVV